MNSDRDVLAQKFTTINFVEIDFFNENIEKCSYRDSELIHDDLQITLGQYTGYLLSMYNEFERSSSEFKTERSYKHLVLSVPSLLHNCE